MTEFQPSEMLNPSMSQEEQDRNVEDAGLNVIGPPGYASPDPNTQRGLLVPVEDHPLSGDLSDDYGANVENRAELIPTSPLAGGTTQEVDEEEMTKAELQAEAEKRGLAKSGSKAELVDRITEYDEAQTSGETGDDDDDND